MNIIFGDCLEKLDELEDQSVDCIIIDPPYGISQLNKDWNCEKIEESIARSTISTVKKIPVGMKFNPKDSIDLGLFLGKVAGKLMRLLKPGGFCMVFSQARSVHRVAVSFEDQGFEFREQMIWDYGAGQGKAQSMNNFIKKAKYLNDQEKAYYTEKLNGLKTPQLTPTYESILLMQKPKEGTYVENYIKYGVGLVNFKEGSRKNRFSHPKPNKKEREEADKHPTLKPKSLLVDLIKVFTKEGDLILDCFAGSGTTGVACLETSRDFIMIEKEEKYYKSCLERIKKLTNKTK